MAKTETHTVKIAHKAFPYYVEVEDDISGETVRQERLARRGEEVTLNERDYRRGMKFGAFVDPDAPEPEVSTELDVATADIPEIAAWIESESPSVNELLELTGGDPEIAQKLLEAESAATGGAARSTLVEGLTKIIGENS